MLKWVKVIIIFAGAVLVSLPLWAQWNKHIGTKTNSKEIESAISVHYWITEFNINRDKKGRQR